MERLTKRDKDGNAYYPECFHKCDGVGASEKCDSCDLTDTICETLAAYEDLEEQGLLMRLHCKRGDKVYFIKSAFAIADFPIEAKVTYICGLDCDNDVIYSATTKYNGVDRRFKSSDIGKTVFLTQAEAEEALKKAGGENG